MDGFARLATVESPRTSGTYSYRPVAAPEGEYRFRAVAFDHRGRELAAAESSTRVVKPSSPTAEVPHPPTS